jgi:hypothetical protein
LSKHRYTRCQRQFICLHGSMIFIAMHHDELRERSGALLRLKTKGPPENRRP